MAHKNLPTLVFLFLFKHPLGLSVLLLFGCNNNQKRTNSVETGVKSMGMGQFIPSIDGQIPQLADAEVAEQMAFWGNTNMNIARSGLGEKWYQDYRMNIAAAYAVKPNLNWSIFDKANPLSAFTGPHTFLIRSTVPGQPTSLGDPKQVIAAIGGGVLWTPELNKAPGGIFVPGMAVMSGKDFVSANLSLDADGGPDDDPSPILDPIPNSCPAAIDSNEVDEAKHDTRMMTIAAANANTWLFATPKAKTDKDPSYKPAAPGYHWGNIGVNPRASILSVRVLSQCSTFRYALIKDSSIKALRDKGGALYPQYANEFERKKNYGLKTIEYIINGINYATYFNKGGYKTSVIYLPLRGYLLSPDINLKTSTGPDYYKDHSNEPTNFIDNPCNRPEMWALKMAIKGALDNDIAVVVPAGNDGKEGFRLSQHLFATCDSRTTVVTAVTEEGTMQDFVNLGNVSVATGVTLAADVDDLPSMSIYHDSDTELGYRLVPIQVRDISSGTSGAAAVIAGAVSLLKSAVPDLKPDQINRILQQTATKKHKNGKDLQCVLDAFNPKKPNCGAGILNLGEAMKLAVSEYGGGS